ncbi:MAG TPA: peptidylprolyl isomerase [Thermoanaerobaculia bacterium]|jgi:peptidyl-prolyl cis-trans isomerase C|nr:peptidylprolyl isomerase [Thermoanaerobaculia bacterium]
MNQKTLPRSMFLVLGLALLLAAWTACKPAADKKTEATPGAASTASTTPGQPGQTPAAGSPTFNLNPSANPAAATMTAEKMPDIVAKVNGQAIKKDDLLKGAQVVQMQLAQRGQPIALTPDVYRRVLDELVGITLLQQEAKAQHIAPSDQELDQQVAARKKQFPSEEVYQKALKQTGLTEALFRQQYRDQLAVQKYVESQVISKTPVSEQATKDFYDKNKGQIRSPDRMHLRHILIAVNAKTSPADKEKAQAKAEDLHKQIVGGADFAKLAAANSDDPGSKVRGGDLGWVSPGQIPPAFEKAAMALKANEISPVVESQFGFHIIELLERQAAAQVPYEQVKERLAFMIKQKQAQESVQAKIKELRAKAKVDVYL